VRGRRIIKLGIGLLRWLLARRQRSGPPHAPKANALERTTAQLEHARAQLQRAQDELQQLQDELRCLQMSTGAESLERMKDDIASARETIQAQEREIETLKAQKGYA
jgi:septal ring factor EnvC (AmiA/AmiB activator)